MIAFRFFFEKFYFNLQKQSLRYVSVAMTNYPDKNHLKKGFYFGLQFQGIIHQGGEFKAMEVYTLCLQSGSRD